jgi:hypothetical protein
MADSQLTLILPGWMPAKVDELPALNTLLRLGRPLSGVDAHGALAEAFGLSRQSDWPVASVLAGLAGLKADKGYWLCAEPVHLEAGMNGLILQDLSLDAPTAREMQDLWECVTAELAQVWPEAQLYSSDVGRMFVQLPSPLDLATYPPDSLFHRGVGDSLPVGGDGAALVRLMSGLQVALHAHPVNQARESAGRLAINSFWFWGGGTAGAQAAGPDQIFGAGELIASLAGARLLPFPEKLPPVHGQVLARAPVDWNMLESGWFRPLLSRLRWGRLGCLRLAFVDGCVELSPRDIWRLTR